MKRHPTNIAAFVCGLLYVTLSVLFALDALDRTDLDLRWIPATVLIGLGLAGVLGSVVARRPAREIEDRSQEAEPEALS